MNCRKCVWFIYTGVPHDTAGTCSNPNSEYSCATVSGDSRCSKFTPCMVPAYYVGKEKPELFVPFRAGDNIEPYFPREHSHRTMDEDHIMREVNMNQVADDMEKSIAALKKTTFELIDWNFKMAEIQLKLRQAEEAEKAARCKCWWCRIKFRIMDKISDMVESGVLHVK